MKTLLRSLLLGGLLSALPLPGFAAAFEGKISFLISSGKNSQNLNYALREDAMRMEIDAEGQTMASIIDLQKREMIMMMPKEKMYMVLPFKETVEKAFNEAELKQHNIEKTGRTDTILGYKVEEYVSKEKNSTSEIWVAEGLGTFMGLSAGEGGPMGGRRKAAAQAWENAFKGKPGFPLRVVTRDAKNKETYKMEATKVEPGKLPASLFQPPADFQRFQMPNLGDLNPFKKKG
ncbi:MAG TPA: DUF4412 domain-containing protein [Opitutaceae bacterium]|nr:DUF4412 domain-containing protein [Opitutaceae bacterium]